MKASNIREHMEIVAANGTHVGEVDSFDSQCIKTTKNDPNSGGKHHFIPCDWVDHVDEQVHLRKDSADVFENWKTEGALV